MFINVINIIYYVVYLIMHFVFRKLGSSGMVEYKSLDLSVLQVKILS